MCDGDRIYIAPVVREIKREIEKIGLWLAKNGSCWVAVMLGTFPANRSGEMEIYIK